MSHLLRRLAAEDGAASGPFAPYIYLMSMIAIVVALLGGYAFFSGIVRDQSTMASALDNAANAAARHVGVRALASGRAVLDANTAETTFTDYLTANDGLAYQGASTYVPTSPTTLQSLTAQVSAQSGPDGGLAVTVKGDSVVNAPVPLIGTVKVGIPQNAAVEPRAVIARIAGG